MKTIIALCVAASFLVACDDSGEVGTTHAGHKVYKEVCIDGVVYLERTFVNAGFFSVKFNPDSTVVTCEVKYP